MSQPIPKTCPKCGKALTSVPIGDGQVKLTCSCGAINEVRDAQGRKLLIDGPAEGLTGSRKYLTG